MDTERVMALPISVLRQSRRRLVMELSSGRRFCIRGGRDERVPPANMPYFSPDEMIRILNSGLSEESFMGLLNVKSVFAACSINSVEKLQPGGGAPKMVVGTLPDAIKAKSGTSKVSEVTV